MAERFAFGTLEDAIVTLLNANTSDLNSGLSKSVVTIATKELTQPVGNPLYPAIYIQFNSADFDFRGPSKRKTGTLHYTLTYYTHNRVSRDASRDDADQLASNIIYILDSNVSLTALSSTNGYLKVTGVSYDYNLDDSGFVTKGTIRLDIIRHNN